MPFTSYSYCSAYNDSYSNTTVEWCYCSTDYCNADMSTAADSIGNATSPTYQPPTPSAPPTNLTCWQTYYAGNNTWHEPASGCQSCYITETTYCEFHLLLYLKQL